MIKELLTVAFIATMLMLYSSFVVYVGCASCMLPDKYHKCADGERRSEAQQVFDVSSSETFICKQYATLANRTSSATMTELSQLGVQVFEVFSWIKSV
jgi:hypothetical protein